MSAKGNTATVTPFPGTIGNPADESIRDEDAANWPSFTAQGPEPKDHFAERNGVLCAGTHLIVDFWDAKRLTDLKLMERALQEAALAGGATLLHVHLHHFSENDGISGVAVLAESHISVHTWPERGYAAFDVFMCG
ncbi:MAG: adenosylmethionine decarboxylase, partial [Gammaproteobacteria bacterium]|nr:adenosylmethionine decarboxylase [Gammaproteobacteria bacterium]